MSELAKTTRYWDDWVSPILMKELRQGLREKTFMLAFLSLQMGMGLLVMFRLSAQSSSANLQTQSGFFMAALWCTFVIAIPLRGISAIAQEMKQNTLETVLLTRMTGWRVVVGKWTAQIFQAFLLATTVLPFMLIQYLVGGEELVENITKLGLFFCVCGFMSAVLIGLSAIQFLFARICALIAVIIFASIGFTTLAFGVSTTGFDWENVVWFALPLIFIPLVIFEWVTVTLAPHIEGRTTFRRLMAVTFLGLCWGVNAFKPESGGLMMSSTLFVLFCVLELCQREVVLSRRLRLLTRFGIFGKIWALFFTQGWQSGVPFALIAIPSAIYGSICFNHDPSVTAPMPVDDQLSLGYATTISIFGSAFIPLLLIQVFMPKTSVCAFLMILYNVIAAVVLELITQVLNLSGASSEVLGYIPNVTLMVQSSIETSRARTEAVDGTVVIFVVLGCLARMAWPWVTEMNRLWEEAKVPQKAIT